MEEFLKQVMGESWFPIFDDYANLSISALVFDPQNSDIIYAGTGDHNISGYPFVGDGIYKTEDAGETWIQLGLSEQSIVSRIVIHPDSSNIIYTATMGVPFVRNTERGLYKTINGGQTWEQVLFISEDAGIIDLVINPEQPQTLYAVGWNRIRNAFESLIFGDAARIYKTNDGGNNWTILTGGLPQDEGSRIGICMSKQNPDKLYALYLDENYQVDEIYKTEDGGNNWIAIPTGGLDDNLMGGFGWYFGQIRVNPANDDEIYVLGVKMMKTSNGGTTWNYCPSNDYYDQHVDKHDLFFIDENTLISATDGGMYFSDNRGLTWMDLEDIPNTQFYRITYDPHNPGFYSGGTQDNGTIYGNSSIISDWDHRLGGDGFQVLFDYNDAGTGYAMTQNGSIYYHDWGDWYNWNYFTYGIDDNDRRSWDMPLIMSKTNSNVLYTGTYRIYKVENAPYEDWYTISEDLTDGIDSRYYIISAIEESAFNTAHLFAGTSDGNVWRTSDGGTNWQNITADLPERFVSSIKTSPDNENVVFIAHTGYKVNDYIPHIHISEDNGDTWTDISGNLPQFAINDMYILENYNDSVIFTATDGGVYASITKGGEWIRIGNNMPLIQVYDIDYDPVNVKLIAGTYARSMMSFPVDSVINAIDSDNIIMFAKNKLRLYPNPVRDILFIDNLDLNSPFRIDIYSMAGTNVKSMSIEHAEETVSVDLIFIKAGIYNIIITRKEGIFTGKFMKIN